MNFSFGWQHFGFIGGLLQRNHTETLSIPMPKTPKPESKPKPVRFSYSTADQSAIQRAVIQTIEKIGGQRKLKKLYFQHQKSVAGGENFFDAAVRLLKLNVQYDEAELALTPKTGPVLFIANHPYGVLDGITLTWLAIKVRPDTKVLANDVLCQAPEAANNLLPVGALSKTRIRHSQLANLSADDSRT